MDIKKIFKVARSQTNTSKEKYTDEQLIVDLNFLYQRIWRELVARDENYFWTCRKTDIKTRRNNRYTIWNVYDQRSLAEWRTPTTPLRQ